MAKIFITPTPGTARMICGKVMTGGIHYAAVNKVDLEARNAMALGYAVQLEGVELKDGITVHQYEELYRETLASRERDSKESAEDFYANVVRFTVEALNSEQNGVSTVEPKKTAKKSTPKAETPKAETTGETAEKAGE